MFASIAPVVCMFFVSQQHWVDAGAAENKHLSPKWIADHLPLAKDHLDKQEDECFMGGWDHIK